MLLAMTQAICRYEDKGSLCRLVVCRMCWSLQLHMLVS